MTMKERNIIYSFICALFCFIALSCSDETENAFESMETGLILQINTGENTFTRADETSTSSTESSLDNTIRCLDVFIFDSETGYLVEDCYFHFGDGTSDIINTVCLISGNWKNRFLGHETCDVYVVANLHIFTTGENVEEGKAVLSNIRNLSSLKQLVDKYESIYMPVSIDSKMPFSMSGYCLDWQPSLSPNIYTISVELERLAAKIEISLDMQFEYTETEINGKKYNYPTNEDIGQLQYSVHNYATNALVLSGNDDTFEYDVASSSETNIKFVDKDNEGKSVPKIIAYTYPTEWTNDILKETYIIFNAQLKAIDETEYMNNYYKIPLRLSNDENKMLERNHWYKVKATISEKGNATPDKPVELTNVRYEVAPWNDINIDINGDTPMYLELSEYDVVMRNVDTYDLTFASSSQIVKDEADNENAFIEIEEIYYYNKNGKKIEITDTDILDNTYLSVEGSLNGHLLIHSPIPENKTIRYITLTVKNTQYNEDDPGTDSCIKTVTIKQYPLEYITGIAGLYSYLINDIYKRYNQKWPSSLNTIGGGTISEIIQDGLDGHIGNDLTNSNNYKDRVYMKSKFYLEDNSKIYRIDYSYDEDNYYRENTDAHNNRMYHVVISSTSPDYTLARPIMTNDSKEINNAWEKSDDPRQIVDPNNAENEDLVSPSFMLASQLGNTDMVTWKEAKEQCKNYVEVDNNKEVYDDWRLPTAAEIGILIKYQSDIKVNTGNDYGVMDNILNSEDKDETNPYYWVSSDNKYVLVKRTYNKNEQLKNDRDKCRVRCVRDFHVGEPTE